MIKSKPIPLSYKYISTTTLKVSATATSIKKYKKCSINDLSQLDKLNANIMDRTDQKTLVEVSEIELSYRTKVKPSERPKITCSKDAYDILRKYWNEDTIELVEEFKILLLNRANKVIGIFKVSNGSSTGTVVDPKLVFVAALKANACGIILSHNHPSGNLSPSTPDIALSKKIKDGAKLLELSVLDHIIVTSDAYYSFADEGLL